MRVHTTVALALAFSSLIVLGTTCATRAQTDATTSYSEALKLCSVEWKASDTRKQVAKGEGMAAWQKFRAACVTEKGYVPTRRNVTRSAETKSE